MHHCIFKNFVGVISKSVNTLHQVHFNACVEVKDVRNILVYNFKLNIIGMALVDALYVT